jgi:SAM-dependent methyltransferase
MSDTERTNQLWSRHSAQFSGRETGLFWLEKPEIQRSINSKISGDPNTNWIQYTLRTYFAGRLPLAKCLSLGCGEGRLERTLALLNTFQGCDAYDLAEGSIQLARRQALEKGLNTISYQVTDINKMKLPVGIYDAVWIDSALHHFEALEHICQQLRQALKPDGLLILNEYIGPSRFQFPARQKEIANLCFQLLPTRYRFLIDEAVELEGERSPFQKGAGWFISRLIDKLRDGNLLDTLQRRILLYRSKISGRELEEKHINFPSAHDVIAADPSEAIRSGEIVEVLQKNFVIVEQKMWGGNVFQFLLAGIAGNFREDDPLSQELLCMLIKIEESLMHCGEFQSDFAYLVARPLPY